MGKKNWKKESLIEINVLLTAAVARGDIKLTKYYLKKGGNINDALVMASVNGRDEIIELLLSRGADPQIYDNEPIRQASKHDHLSTVKLLISNGANKDNIEISLDKLKPGDLKKFTYKLRKYRRLAILLRRNTV